MTKLSVEITTTDKEGRIGTTALSELLYNLHRMIGAPDFIVLQGPPGVRTVIQYMVTTDREVDATLRGELVLTSTEPEVDYWAGI